MAAAEGRYGDLIEGFTPKIKIVTVRPIEKPKTTRVLPEPPDEVKTPPKRDKDRTKTDGPGIGRLRIAEPPTVPPPVAVAPVYPARAIARQLEGYVVLEFTVTRIGTVRDAFVVTSTNSVFDRPAMEAVYKFKYKPRVVDGEPVEAPGVCPVSEIGAYEAKTHLPRLLQRVQAGERFVITRHNRPVAELIPFQSRDPEKVRSAIAALKTFQQSHSLDGLSIRRMIEEGRRY